VELALILPFLLIIMAVPLYFGRVLWHYSAAQKASQDAARYMATVSQREYSSAQMAAAVSSVAHDIVNAEISDLNPGLPIGVSVECDTLTCDGVTMPQTVRVVVRMRMVDFIFPDVTTAMGFETFILTADTTMPYVGH
jgi:Flp pilus assembly protein TadG